MLAVPAAAQPPANLNIAEIHWGFDGAVMKGRFSPLTLVVDNPGGEPFDGELRVYRGDFGGGRVGGFLVEQVYLAPSTRRIVQFYPYVMSDTERWYVEWEGGRVQLSQQLQIGDRARVILANDESLYDRGGAVKRFPERFFPPHATATDGLGEVVLDHAPDWGGPRRDAFLDWLRQGGTLHLLNGPSGKRPEFGEGLQMLNEPSEEFFVGGGRVQRHPISRFQLTRDYVRQQLDAPPPEKKQGTADALIEDYQNQYQQQQQGYGYGTNYHIPLEQWSFNQEIFEKLKKTVSADHDWGMIHLLSLAYVAVLFPGCFMIGREYRNSPLTLGVILGSTLLFGGAFYLVGNRGYGESTSVHGVALARHVEGGRFDVMEWSNVFVTNGGYYALSNQGNGLLYSDATSTEAVGGLMTSGSEGQFLVDIPPFSSRIMTRKALVEVPGGGPVKAARDESAGSNIQFQLPKGFPKDVIRSYILIDDEGMGGRVQDGKLVSGVARPIEEMFKIQTDPYNFGMGMNGEEEKPDLTDERLVRELVLYSLGVNTDKELEAFRVPEGVARVYLYARRPEVFVIRASEGDLGEETTVPPEKLGQQRGYVLYQFDVPL